MASRGSWSWSTRWTAEEAREALRVQAASGQSVAAFARAEGLPPSRLYWWRSRLSPTSSSSEMAFVEVEQGSSKGPAKEASALEVVTVSGRVVRVSRDFDAETLRRLLDVLEGEAC